MPAYRFWGLNKNANRLEAAETMNLVNAFASVHSKDGPKDFFKTLEQQRGTVSVVEEGADPEAMGKLQQLQEMSLLVGLPS